MIQRIVLIKTEQKERLNPVLEKVKELPKKVDGIVSTHVSFDSGGRSKGYDALFMIDFKNDEVVANWPTHPEHIPIRSTLVEIAEMIVFDRKLLEV